MNIESVLKQLFLIPKMKLKLINYLFFSSRRKRLASAAKRASSLIPCNLELRISARLGPRTSELELTTSNSALKTMEFLVEDLEDFCKSKKLHPNFSKLVNTGKQYWNVQPREVQRHASLGKSIMTSHFVQTEFPHPSCQSN